MNRSTTTRVLAVAALLALAGSADLAGQQPERLQRARQALPRAAATRLDQLLQAADARGLPTAPLVDKVLEGEAKQVSPDRILAAVAQLSDNLGRARTLLQDGAAPSADDLTAVADAIRRGVPDGAVRALHSHRPDQSLSMPVLTLADLVQEGVPVERALDLLKAWADRGARPNELRELPAAVERLIREGTLPAQAAIAVTRSMEGGSQGRVTSPGKSESAPGHVRKTDRPPVPPGAGPPEGKGKGKSSRAKG